MRTQDTTATQAPEQTREPAPITTTMVVEPVRASVPVSRGRGEFVGGTVAGVFLGIVGTLVAFALLGERRKRAREKQAFDLSILSQEREQKQQGEYHELMLGKAKLEQQLARAELMLRAADLGDKGQSRLKMNELVQTKMGLEIELLRSQVELSRRQIALRSDELDYHDVQMERVRLEIESLKLRIKEQRKGLDEFGAG